MLKCVSFFLMITGLIILIIATVRYHKLLAVNKEQIHCSRRISAFTRNSTLFLLYFFITDFFIGSVDLFVRKIELLDSFVVIDFFLCACFVFKSITMQREMNDMVNQKTEETMRAFINAVELKDKYTKGHSMHVRKITGLLYDQLPDSMKKTISKSMLLDAALLHDVGKIGIDDEILNKQGKLTVLEWEIIKSHPMYSEIVLEDTCYSEIGNWVLYHHERIDGKGYYNLPGADIPVESKMIAIADTYSALTTDRVYRTRYSHKDACDIMLDVAGTQLDETLLQYFMQIPEEKLASLNTHKDIYMYSTI